MNTTATALFDGSPAGKQPREIEIYVHTCDHEEPKLIKVSEEATVGELLKKVAPENHSDLHLVVEDEEEAKENHHRLCDCGVHHRHHLHCHRCKSIEVVVLFNGVDHKKHFPPSKTIAKILHWALKEFKLSGADATNKTLRLTSRPDESLPERAHVGSFAKHHHCCVELNLADAINPNG